MFYVHLLILKCVCLLATIGHSIRARVLTYTRNKTEPFVLHHAVAIASSINSNEF